MENKFELIDELKLNGLDQDDDNDIDDFTMDDDLDDADADITDSDNVGDDTTAEEPEEIDPEITSAGEDPARGNYDDAPESTDNAGDEEFDIDDFTEYDDNDEIEDGTEEIDQSGETESPEMAQDDQPDNTDNGDSDNNNDNPGNDGGIATDNNNPRDDNQQDGEVSDVAEEDEDGGIEDFTQDDFDDPVDGEDSEEAPEGEEDPDAENSEGEETGTDEGEETQEEDEGSLQGLERNLFADLTPQQIAIKNGELLQSYIDLYDTLDALFDDINKIPKTYNNTRALEFITTKIVELKDMAHATITSTYQTKTYVENLTVYKQYLLVLQQLNTMLKGLVQKSTK